MMTAQRMNRDGLEALNTIGDDEENVEFSQNKTANIESIQIFMRWQ